MNVTLWDSSSDVRKELSIQDDRTESDNRIEETLLIGIAENNLPHIARWESTKPPYAEPHVRWCGRSVNVKIGGKCLLWLAFTSYPIIYTSIADTLTTAKTRKTHITIRYSIHLTSQQHFKQTFETKPKATELTFIMRFRSQKSMSYKSKIHELWDESPWVWDEKSMRRNSIGKWRITRGL